MKTSESAARGQKIVTSSPPDKSSHKVSSGERSMKDRGVIMDPDLYNGASKNGNVPK
jgi:hypothetical protein